MSWIYWHFALKEGNLWGEPAKISLNEALSSKDKSAGDFRPPVMTFRPCREAGKGGILQRLCVLKSKPMKLLSWQAQCFCDYWWLSWELSLDRRRPSLSQMWWPLQNNLLPDPGSGQLPPACWCMNSSLLQVWLQPGSSSVLSNNSFLCLINQFQHLANAAKLRRKTETKNISMRQELPRAVCAFKCQIVFMTSWAAASISRFAFWRATFAPWQVQGLGCSVGREKLLALPSPMCFFPSEVGPQDAQSEQLLCEYIGTAETS